VTETATQDLAIEQAESVELTSGPSGLPGAMSVMLDAGQVGAVQFDSEPFDGESLEAAPLALPLDGRLLPTAVAVNRQLAATIRTAGLVSDVESLRVLRVERMSRPIPSRRVDILV